MWHAYNLIREGDTVTATTFRKVQKDSAGTSAAASERIKIKLEIKVEEVDFDAEGASLSLFICFYCQTLNAANKAKIQSTEYSA